MNSILWFDPGKSSGIALGTYSDTEPFQLVKAWQVEGGLLGLSEWRDEHYSEPGWNYYFDEDDPGHFDPGGSHPVVELRHLFIGCEKFTPRPNQGFSLTLDSVEPLRCEGMLVDRGLLTDYATGNPHWSQPAQQYFLSGKNKAEKKKRQHAWLKEHDLYVTGKMLDAPNADDARSAIAHIISYLKRSQHMPTLQHYFGGSK